MKRNNNIKIKFKGTCQTKDGVYKVDLPPILDIVRIDPYIKVSIKGTKIRHIGKYKTELKINVYNTKTDSFGRKTVYMDEYYRLFFVNSINHEKYYIDELIDINKEKEND